MTNLRTRLLASTTILGTMILGTMILGTGAAAGGTAAAATTGTAPLQVVAAAPAAWPAGHPITVTVAVHNPDATFLCSDFTVTLVWWRPGAPVHRSLRVAGNELGNGTTTLTIPGAAVRPGLHYYAKARQSCGMLEPQQRFEGRSPMGGAAVVGVVGP